MMRYADVILMLAEVNMYQGNTAGAITYINMVRARANMPDYATSMANPAYATAYPTLKLAILHERRVELAFEHHRCLIFCVSLISMTGDVYACQAED